MATSTRHLCRSLWQASRTSRSKRIDFSTPRCRSRPCRQFSSATLRYADDTAATGRRPAYFAGAEDTSPTRKSPPAQQEDVLHESEYLTPAQPYTVSDLSPEERADYEVLSKADQVNYLKLQNHFKAIFEGEEGQEEMEAMANQVKREMDLEDRRKGTGLEFPIQRLKNNQLGFWGEDDEDEFAQVEDGDDDFSEDMITSVAESELDLHRDIREYTRIAAWDLPLLQQYVKPFQPPNHATPLRFRYTTYMGETHPAQNKVVVEFCTKDLLSTPSSTHKISEAQRSKLIKLAGVRYNPTTDIIKMSSEKFDTAAQNKRYLGELVGNLIKESKDASDMFEDVPFDFRHIKEKKKIEFPESWKLKPDTVKKLAETRRQKAQLLLGEAQVATPEEIVDGEKLVEAYVRVGAVKQARTLRV